VSHTSSVNVIDCDKYAYDGESDIECGFIPTRSDLLDLYKKDLQESRETNVHNVPFSLEVDDRNYSLTNIVLF
jgi:hypothetical protein